MDLIKNSIFKNQSIRLNHEKTRKIWIEKTWV